MIPVTVESRLVWCKSAPHEVWIPEGTLVRDFLTAIGKPALEGQALVIIGKEVCNPEREIRPMDKVILLSAMSGG